MIEKYRLDGGWDVFVDQLSTINDQLKLVSVAGLAPARVSLKGWTRELLCIHGQKLFAPFENLLLTRNVQQEAICPRCRAEIPLDDINVSKDVALCRACGRTWSYADLIKDDNEYRDLKNPPSGAWFRETSPRAFEVGVSTRSAIAFFLVPFMCVWSGFSLGGIYGSQFTKGHFELGPSLFGIPFILGTLLFGSIAVMSVCGKVVVNVDGDNGVIFTGVGPIGWRRRFNWRNVSGIRRTERYGNRGSVSQQITFDGEKRLDLAAGVKDERLDFMFAVLREKWRESGR